MTVSLILETVIVCSWKCDDLTYPKSCCEGCPAHFHHFLSGFPQDIELNEFEAASRRRDTASHFWHGLCWGKTFSCVPFVTWFSWQFHDTPVSSPLEATCLPTGLQDIMHHCVKPTKVGPKANKTTGTLAGSKKRKYWTRKAVATVKCSLRKKR